MIINTSSMVSVFGQTSGMAYPANEKKHREEASAVPLKKLLRRADAALSTMLFPRQTVCVCCKKLTHDTLLCPSCADELTECRLTKPLCPLCGHPAYGRCTFCSGSVPGQMRSVWRHRGVARRIVHQLKYGGVSSCADFLAGPMADCALSLHLPDNVLVTWVTMPRSRLRTRGIDHSRLLAESVARRLGLECRCLLSRRDEGRTQRGLTREQRLRNLNGAFAALEQLDRPVLLIDDVMTTSATARICSAVLLQSGATSVAVVTATQA